jgi:hypothetical protein
MWLASKATFISMLSLVLLFLINYSKHLLYHLVAAIVALTSTHLGVVRTLYWSLDHTIAGIMLILNAVLRSSHVILKS